MFLMTIFSVERRGGGTEVDELLHRWVRGLFGLFHFYVSKEEEGGFVFCSRCCLLGASIYRFLRRRGGGERS